MFDRHQKELSDTRWNFDSNELREASFSVQFRKPILVLRWLSRDYLVLEIEFHHWPGLEELIRHTPRRLWTLGRTLSGSRRVL